MASQEETHKLTTRFVDLVTNENGEMLANVFENQAFQTLYDPTNQYTR